METEKEEENQGRGEGGGGVIYRTCILVKYTPLS